MAKNVNGFIAQVWKYIMVLVITLLTSDDTIDEQREHRIDNTVQIIGGRVDT